MIDLDDANEYGRLDPSGMGELIAGFAGQCRKAWENVQRFNLPQQYREADKLLILGMGGSAIGGDLLRTAVEGECRVPIFVSREYSVPAWVNSKTLVVGSSYSGNTEETLSAFDQARSRGAMLLAVTTGGALAERQRQAGGPLLTFEFKGQPRAALAYSFVSLLGIVARLGWIGDPESELQDAIRDVEHMENNVRRTAPLEQNPAKQLAIKLEGYVPVIYGSGMLGEVAHRWKTQFNENAKTIACYEYMSELNHNAVVGYEYPVSPLEDFFLISLESRRLDPRIQRRFEVTKTLLSQHGLAFERVEVTGANPLGEMLTSVHMGDYVTYYEAILNGIDPTPVEAIDFLKRELAKQ